MEAPLMTRIAMLLNIPAQNIPPLKGEGGAEGAGWGQAASAKNTGARGESESPHPAAPRPPSPAQERGGGIGKACARIVFALALVLPFASAAHATKIERIVSPAGIEAWLVREPSVPLIALSFSFRGGASQDAAGKTGTAYMASSLLDEGAGPYDSRVFQERLDAKAIEISFNAGQDQFTGSLRTLTENKDEAFDLLRLALTEPRFEAGDVERIRGQVMSILRRESTNPDSIAYKKWWAEAFPDHPYGRPSRGTPETVPAITVDDLQAFVRDTFARDGLKVAIVGNVDAGEAARLVDKVFGGLPAAGKFAPVADVAPKHLGQRIAETVDVPQSVVVVGGPGVPRKDPDFMAAYIVNHILGGGSFSSRLYREVREERGLAYSVYSSLFTLKHSALFMSATATRADRAADTLEVIDKEIRRLAAEGPTEDELAKAKSYLLGSYALNFDTSGKIANQLVAIQFEDLGIDYITRRNDLIGAVTLADAKRVAKRLLDTGMLVTVVGRAPAPAAATPPAKGG
jgi:zinc protease